MGERESSKSAMKRPGPGVEGVDHHLAVDRAGDLHPPVLQVGRHRGDAASPPRAPPRVSGRKSGRTPASSSRWRSARRCRRAGRLPPNSRCRRATNARASALKTSAKRASTGPRTSTPSPVATPAMALLPLLAGAFRPGGVAPGAPRRRHCTARAVRRGGASRRRPALDGRLQLGIESGGRRGAQRLIWIIPNRLALAPAGGRPAFAALVRPACAPWSTSAPGAALRPGQPLGFQVEHVPWPAPSPRLRRRSTGRWRRSAGSSPPGCPWPCWRGTPAPATPPWWRPATWWPRGRRLRTPSAPFGGRPRRSAPAAGGRRRAPSPSAAARSRRRADGQGRGPGREQPPGAPGRLLEGNRRYVAERMEHPRQGAFGATPGAGQHPFAAVLGCADSRVPVEIVFDQGLGDLFVVRSAGPVLDERHPGQPGVRRRALLHAPPAGPRPRALRRGAAGRPGRGSSGRRALARRKPSPRRWTRQRWRPGDLLENTLRAHAARLVDALRRGQPVLAPAVDGGTPARRRGPLRPGQRAGGGHRPLTSRSRTARASGRRRPRRIGVGGAEWGRRPGQRAASSGRAPASVTRGRRGRPAGASAVRLASRRRTPAAERRARASSEQGVGGAGVEEAGAGEGGQGGEEVRRGGRGLRPAPQTPRGPAVSK